MFKESDMVEDNGILSMPGHTWATLASNKGLIAFIKDSEPRKRVKQAMPSTVYEQCRGWEVH